ncbi:MAG: alkaline phosphatase D family protein, partial [Pseudomonadota bacterium]
VVIGSGDMHQHLVGYLPSDLDDPLSPPLASEFLATSVTSGGSGSPRQAHQLHTLDHNPHVALLNNQRGYQLYRVDAGQWATDIKVLDQVDRPGGQMSNLATYVVEQGKPGPILL